MCIVSSYLSGANASRKDILTHIYGLNKKEKKIGENHTAKLNW